jgi:hypothetical protein
MLVIPIPLGYQYWEWNDQAEVPTMRIPHQRDPRRSCWPRHHQGQGRSRETKRQARRLAEGPQKEETAEGEVNPNTCVTIRGSSNQRPASIGCPDDAGEYKELYAPTGPALQFLRIQIAFESAGYVVRRAELFPHDLPVVVFRLKRTTDPKYSGQAQFRQQVLQILGSVLIRFDEADVVTEQTGDKALVSFLWQPPSPSSVEGLDLNELLAILPWDAQHGRITDQWGHWLLDFQVEIPLGPSAPETALERLQRAKERIPPHDAKTQAVFDQGHEVGSLAKKLFPGGIEVGQGIDDLDEVRRLSREAIKARRPLFEAAFTYHGGYLTRCAAL